MTLLTVSRRTDVPHWHPEWFMNRVRAGHVRYKNPMGPQIVEVSLKPEDVTAIVFWTKNFAPMMKYLPEFEATGIPYYTTYTINPYGPVIEPKLPGLGGRINTFCQLAERDRPVIWRYDPIFLSERFDLAYHESHFKYLCERLSGATTECRISFLDEYAKVKFNMAILPPEYKPLPLTTADMGIIAMALSEIASQYGIRVTTCTEAKVAAVPAGACVDPEIIRKLTGNPKQRFYAGNQRDGCKCVQSKDIGAYDTCATGCSYCYANRNPACGATFLAKEFDAARDSLKIIPIQSVSTS